jgi:DNA invertase Pin-like site-specific DNA recombinase
MATGNFIAYYRVSTTKQGINGLGIDSQKETVMKFLNGGSWKLLDEFTEVESGKKDDRPQLMKAIKLCQLKNAKLVVSKLDRLSRDLHFITSLQKSGIKFVVAENPEANDLTCHIFAAIAQNEALLISKRTKDALAQAKKRGVKLGNPAILNGGQIPGSGNTQNARSVKTDNANDFAMKMMEIIEDIISSESTTLRAIAKELNNRNFTTRRSNMWTANAVRLTIMRYQRLRQINEKPMVGDQ